MLRTRFLIVIMSLLSLAACSGVKPEAKYPDRRGGDRDIVYAGEREGIFGKGGMGLFGKKKDNDAVGITVNAYLWRAALDTLSFMPMASADPFGGTIITEWYEAPETKGERIKANVLILSRELRTDALKVNLFRQIKNKSGQWQDAAVDPKTVTHLEESILTRAREMRVATKEAQ